MASTKGGITERSITKHRFTAQPTLKKYLESVGVVPSYNLNNSIICGLPAVWMYLRSIGLEDLYFEILQKVQTRSSWFRELFYLLVLTNKHNEFLPKPPDDLLKLKIKPEVVAAQIPMPTPEFRLAYSFTTDQLHQILDKVTQAGKLVRIGNKQIAIGVMRNKDGTYAVYHANNERPLEFKTLDKCVEVIIRMMDGK